ncbi:MAG TPA: iron ABC transporter permease [Rectinemataceae bacterium]|nr:iron ABC transporter permease [Rectinemataceae bacterium]
MKPGRTHRARLGAAIAALSFLLALLVSLCIGSSPLPPGQVLSALATRLIPGLPAVSGTAADPMATVIVWDLRLARSLLAGVAGAALGAAGAVMQGLFRNPLADPYALGVSSGASLGAVAAISLGLSSPLVAIGATEILAFAGALGSAFMVYAIARSARRQPQTAALLLAGAAVGSFLGALVSLIVTLDSRDLQRVFFWLLGGFGGKSWPDLGAALPLAAASIGLSSLLARPLDLLGAGEEAASSLGLDIERTRRLAVAASSLGVAAAVSAGGIIGFVGLLGPHLARLLVGPGHRRLVPVSAFTGAALLMVADAVARSVASPLALPVGIVTAIVGAPLFLRILARRMPGEGPREAAR